MIRSTYWNPHSNTILMKSSCEKRKNVYMNTCSFANKYHRDAPKYKVRLSSKNKADMPQVGYYDSGPAFDKTFGRKVVNSVRMD